MDNNRPNNLIRKYIGVQQKFSGAALCSPKFDAGAWAERYVHLVEPRLSNVRYTLYALYTPRRLSGQSFWLA